MIAAEETVRQQIQAIAGWYRELARPALAARVGDSILEALDQQVKDLERRGAERPRVQVALFGTTGVGKSTLVNAMLGQNLLPMGTIGSTTAAEVIIRQGPRRRVLVDYLDRATLEKYLEDLRVNWARAEEEARSVGEIHDPEHDDLGHLRSIARNAYGFSSNYSLRLAEIQGPLPKNVLDRLGKKVVFEGNFEDDLQDHVAGRVWALVREVTVELPHPLLAKGLEIVDLPGTSDIDQGHLEATRRYVANADQFMLVVGPTGILDDIKSLIQKYGLLATMLQSRIRAPLIVLGTKLDGIGEARAEQIEQAGLSHLPRLRAAEVMWERFVRTQLELLMRPTVQNLIGSDDPKLVQEALNERFGLSRAHCISVNPKAALYLDPTTCPPRKPQNADTLDEQLRLFRAQYPKTEDSGIPRLRKVLEEVTEARYAQYWQDVKGSTLSLRKLLAETLENHIRAVKTSNAEDAVETALEVTDAAKKQALAELEKLSQQLAAMVQAWKTQLDGEITNAGNRAQKRGPASLTHDLRDVRWNTLRAAVQPHRLGIWRSVHLPHTVFGSLEEKVADRWREHVARGTEEFLKLLNLWREGRVQALLGVIQHFKGPLKATLQSRIDQTNELVRVEMERLFVRIRTAQQALEATAPTLVVQLSKEAIRPDCELAVQRRGTGVKGLMMQDLVQGTARAGDTVRAKGLTLLRERIDEVHRSVEQDLIRGCSDLFRAASTDLTKVFREVLTGPANPLRDAARRIKAALERLPDEEGRTPVVAAPTPTPQPIPRAIVRAPEPSIVANPKPQQAAPLPSVGRTPEPPIVLTPRPQQAAPAAVIRPTTPPVAPSPRAQPQQAPTTSVVRSHGSPTEAKPGGSPNELVLELAGAPGAASFQLALALNDEERLILRKLAQDGMLTERVVGRLLSRKGASFWMAEFVARLVAHGHGFVEHGEDTDEGASYRFRREKLPPGISVPTVPPKTDPQTAANATRPTTPLKPEQPNGPVPPRPIAPAPVAPTTPPKAVVPAPAVPPRVTSKLVDPPQAMYSFGTALRDGRTGRKDVAQGFEWIRRAAESGSVAAMNDLGYALLTGEGQPKNYDAALFWLRKAAQLNDPDAMFNLGFALSEGDGPRNFPAAAQWFASAAIAGDCDGMNSFGHALLHGLGVPKDEATAVTWFRKGAEAGNAEAMNNLGQSLARGRGVSKDDSEAARWFLEAAEAGNVDAMHSIATAFRDGVGVERDKARAVEWYRRAAEHGHSQAMNNLGRALRDWGPERNQAEAVQWFRKAAVAGVADAMFNLGCALAEGQGVATDASEASAWLKKAISAGNPNAAAVLDRLGYK